ncbi:TonB-dependent receptor [Rufibacter roseus]|uniref:TonB-dependent receptor domain-containing protein n=1 Tax=Rufibacter roseus TaxID=1567108 RepID=A0ABW2DIB2_9BACT|nr:TonB-dependent receptor [Rufibacter roseus]
MRKYALLCLMLALLVLPFTSVFAQTSATQTVSGSFSKISFEQFVKQVEAQTTYRFYFNPAQTDSLTVSLEANQQPLPTVLEQLFRNTDYRFAIDGEQRVFVTKGAPLQAKLPADFLNVEGEDSGDEVIPGYISGNRQKTQAVGSETKLYEIGIKTNKITPGNATLRGTVRDAASGEPVIGAVVMIENPLTATNTDENGNYAISLPKGRHTLKIRSVGMRETKRQLMLYSDGRLSVDLISSIVSLNEVLVKGNRDRNVASTAMGVEKLGISTIKQVPTAFGEADVLKVVLTLPGVKSVGESSTGLNVRGGATDQNLILLNDATIFNPSHLFGFFSAFNPDVVKGIELYKSTIPAKYGGRLASVLDISTREGNKQKFAGAGGIGLIASRLMLEGPIVKDKTSFLIGGRASYSDWLLAQLPNENLSRSKASFYDLNLGLNHTINENNTLSLTGYFSNDNFKLASDTLYKYQNQSLVAKWGHAFTDKLYNVLTASYSGYNYNVTSDKNEVNAYELAYDQKQVSMKTGFTYNYNHQHTVEFGGSTMLHQMSPGSYKPLGEESLVIPDEVEQEQGLESALYLSDTYEVSPRFSVSVGLRYSFFQYLGSKSVTTYAEGVPKDETTEIETREFGAGDVIKTYHGPEYRASARFSFTESFSVKAGYNRTRQYLHMLTNTAMISPTDIWKLSDSHIQPQIGDQVSLGLFKNFKNNTVEASVEVYHKTMQNMLDYKSGAQLLLNHHIETDVINSKGKAYGIETMLRKQEGKLNGWLSYTYSRSLLQSNGAEYEQKINEGAFYPSNFDQPHNLTMVGNYRFSRRISTSLNFVYSTGRPITLPLSIYEVGGGKRIYYSDRNQFRVPDYYRVDFSLNLEGGHKAKKLAHSSWTLAVYNLTGRRNPYSIYFKSEEGVIKGYKMSVFGRPIPTVTYNFKF